MVETKKVESAVKQSVMILKCVCQHEFQDRKYGKSMRVMNSCVVKPQQPQRFRCTVCGSIRGERE